MIETERLTLRSWRDDDLAAYAASCNTPAVTRFLDGPVSLDDLTDAVGRTRAHQAAHGYTFWAVERRADGAFLGYCGLKRLTELPALAGEVEIGWRLREDAWGQGYAREAAAASLDWAWANLPLRRVVAMTVPANRASWGLMRRLGMTEQPELAFYHPHLAIGHPLARHLVYTLDRP